MYKMHDGKLEGYPSKYNRCGGLISNVEIKKLRDYFDNNQIEYELRYWEEGRFNIHVDLWFIRLSFLTSIGSCGGYEGLIEFYNFKDEPIGYLWADEAIKIYEKVVAGK